MLAPIQKLLNHAANEKAESDPAYFAALMYTGEALMKLAVAGLVAAIQDDREGHRYRLESRLVRANGLGEWGEVLDDVLTGPSAQFLDGGAQTTTQALMERLGEGSWQANSLHDLLETIRCVGLDSEVSTNKRIQGRTWFKEFVRLRNGTRGHGAPASSTLGSACPSLERSITTMASALPLFNLPWAYLHQNLSRKYRVTAWSNTGEMLDGLKRETDHSYDNAVHIELDKLRKVAVVDSNAEGSDYWFANGGFGPNHYEMLSYLTNDRLTKLSAPYMRPAGQLPPSETEGLGQLDVKGSTFTNVPEPVSNYVPRPRLEDELEEQLRDSERHPLVTLTGRGGIGKTSIALQVITKLINSGSSPYDVIVWFSARDVDLLPSGPKVVRPQGLTIDDFATEYTRLLSPDEMRAKGSSPKDYLAKQIGGETIGPTLFVFDNFETTISPVEVFRWLDTYVRGPNKVLITSRSRGFTGDYEVQVQGMSDPEADELIKQTAKAAGIQVSISEEYRDDLISESNGHPYVIKLLLGEVARERGRRRPERIMADQGEVLVALFERSYGRLSPGAQRVFLTLCKWRSSVPSLAVEAVLLRPQNERFDVAAAIQELVQAFFIDETIDAATDEAEVSVPLSARLFGVRKLEVSAWQASIEADVPILHLLGARAGGATPEIGSRIEGLFRNVAEAVATDKKQFSEIRPVLEFITTRYSYASVLLARLVSELYEDESEEEHYLLNYVQGPENPKAPFWQAWKRIATIRKKRGDGSGVLHAHAQSCRDSGTPASELSNAANDINSILLDMRRDAADKVSWEEKQFLIKDVVGALTRSVNDLNATDLSRLAWLQIHLGEPDSALKTVQKGLVIDATNPYCQSLSIRLSRADGEAR